MPTPRNRICTAISNALQPLPDVLAGWESGGAAFGALDAYSDIDLNFLIEDDASADRLYALAERALESVSPITISHNAPPGRYYKLQDGGEFLFIDLCFIRQRAPKDFLNAERHGVIVPLFDKGRCLTFRCHGRGCTNPRGLRRDVPA